MPAKRPKTVNKILNQPTGDIRALMDQLNKIQTINISLQQHVNPVLSQHCKAVNMKKGTLVLAVDSPMWVNKLRFQLPELLNELRKSGFAGLANIELIVKPF
jgi:hypothetical protein